jgi:2-polyprenyl-6-methoxyphenol hydroxylase-like FAD-dependent oxidoreductase
MGSQAVVLGGSLAGLCAARVLADHCERVTVIERDELPDADVVADRAGVPQGRHVHAMLERGRRELEALFPGFDAFVRERGALVLNFGTDFAVLRQTFWQPRRAYRLNGLFLSRPMVDAAARHHLARHANVTVRPLTDVVGLVTGATDRVIGVRLRTRGGGAEEMLSADLVVDATGRASRAPEWLRALGVEPPEETVVDSHCGYSTRWYKAPPPERWPREWWWKGIWLDPDLAGPASELVAGILSPCEGGRWIVTVGGIAGNYPPTDDAGFTASLSRLRSPILAQAVARAEPISPVYSNRMMANRHRHYERWSVTLPGFLAVGDAACAFNPIYGQGMTAAAVSAGILGEQLRTHGPLAPDLPARVFKAQVDRLRGAWDLATGADMRFETTIGKRPPFVKAINGYLDALFLAANDDAVVRDTFAEVMHLLQPPTVLFAPGMTLRVARHALAERVRGTFSPRVPPAPWPAAATV